MKISGQICKFLNNIIYIYLKYVILLTQNIWNLF